MFMFSIRLLPIYESILEQLLDFVHPVLVIDFVVFGGAHELEHALRYFLDPHEMIAVIESK